MMSALQNTFIYLQKLAAGMEQVVIDQADHNGKFLMEFDTAQYALKTVSNLYQNVLIFCKIYWEFWDVYKMGQKCQNYWVSIRIQRRGHHLF